MVVLDARIGGAPTRYRADASVDLADGECAVVVRWHFLEFVFVHRWVEADDVPDGGLMWQLLGPDDPHGDRKAVTNLFALQVRC
jgi:hypothetical protein